MNDIKIWSENNVVLIIFNGILLNINKSSCRYLISLMEI